MTPHTIYFVRHGETVWNTERRLQGRMDSPLTELGRSHALQNAETLLDAVPDLHALPFVSSPLARARATMDIVRARVGLPSDGYSVDEQLAELGFGDWEGMTAREIRSSHPEAWATYEASRWTEVPPGGESYQQLVARLQSWLADLRGDVVVVAHGGVGRTLRGLNLRVPVAEIPVSNTPEHDRVYRLVNGTEAAL
jgi:probable phosphoglycerate mutase